MSQLPLLKIEYADGHKEPLLHAIQIARNGEHALCVPVPPNIPQDEVDKLRNHDSQKLLSIARLMGWTPFAMPDRCFWTTQRWAWQKAGTVAEAEEFAKLKLGGVLPDAELPTFTLPVEVAVLWALGWEACFSGPFLRASYDLIDFGYIKDRSMKRLRVINRLWQTMKK